MPSAVAVNGHSAGKAPRRRRSLINAAVAQVQKGSLKGAISQYLTLIEQHPDDPEAHARVAQLLAKRKQYAEAQQHFHVAAALYLKQGFEERALAVYRSSVAAVTTDKESWQAIARWYRERGYQAEAVKTLLQARSHFNKRGLRPRGIELLRVAFEIEPWHFDATFQLAKALVRARVFGEARQLFEGLEARYYGPRLLRVRGAMFALAPSPRTFWRWSTSLLRRR